MDLVALTSDDYHRCRRVAARHVTVEPAAEIAVAYIGPQRPVQRTALSSVKYARTLIADIWHSLAIKPRHSVRIQARPFTAHARDRWFIQKGVIATAFAAPSLAQRAGDMRHAGGKAHRFRPRWRNGMLAILRLAQCYHQVLAQPSRTLGRCWRQCPVASRHHHRLAVVVVGNTVADSGSEVPSSHARPVAQHTVTLPIVDVRRQGVPACQPDPCLRLGRHRPELVLEWGSGRYRPATFVTL
jgi:hypothetical protein